MNEEITKKLDVLKEKLEEKKTVKQFGEMAVNLSIEQLLDVVRQAVSDISKGISEAILDRVDSKVTEQLNDVNKKLEKVDILDEKIEVLSQKETIVNIPEKVTVANFKDLVIPEGKEFPQEIQAKILDMVKVMDMVPTQTTFDRDRAGFVRTIVENYQDFTITTSFKRDNIGNIQSISSEVSR